MNKNFEDNYYQISQTEHEGWQLSQLQYYVQTMLDLSEADKKDLESKVEQYHSNVTGFKDKIKTLSHYLFEYHHYRLSIARAYDAFPIQDLRLLYLFGE